MQKVVELIAGGGKLVGKQIEFVALLGDTLFQVAFGGYVADEEK